MPAPRPTDESSQGVDLATRDYSPDHLSWNGMTETGPFGSGLIKGLGGVVRGLSVLVWALPLALAIVVWTVARVDSSLPTAFSNLLFSMGVVPGLAITVTLWLGVWQVGRYQPGIPSWQRSADRARGLSLLLIGFSPFLYWWSRRPDVLYFKISAGALILFGLLFLAQLNGMLRRLTAMLPDQALREETGSMARLNYALLAVLAALQILFFALDRVSFQAVAAWVSRQYFEFARLLVLLFMVVPVAITIALMWKIKETILESVFSGDQR